MREWVKDVLESERDRWFLWVPVALALGVSAYFALPREPLLGLLVFLAAMLLLVSYRARNWSPGAFPILLAAMFASGMVLGKARSDWVSAPVLQEPIAGAVIDGWVESVTPRYQGGVRILLRVASIDRLTSEKTPYRVRLNLRGKNAAFDLPPGSRVTIRGWIGPPPGPAAPGDFDFSRKAYFERIGAVGTVFTVVPSPQSGLEAGQGASWGLRAAAWVGTLRNRITARIRASLPGGQGALAAALITGQRGDISREHVENLRTAGLAHILAISGLHMSLAAGSIFVLLRAILALFPPLILHYPVKKIAAVAAILGTTGYLVISGASIATQRAFIMILIMFVAVLLDRPAISMRNIALAALVIILMRPESVLTPSFRMSFAAVTGLVAAYEFRQALGFRRRQTSGLLLRAVKLPFYYLAGVSMTTIVAAAATAPFAAYHFNHMAPFALAGNLFGIPVIAFFIMPAALFSVFAMGLGLEEFPLAVMGWGIDWLLGVASMVAEWPGAVRVVAAMPDSALLVIVLGGLWLALWQRAWRLGGIVVIGCGIGLMWTQVRPDLLIDSRANTVALRDDSGRLQVLVRGRSTYSAERWLERDGDMRGIDQVGAENFSCDRYACVALLADGSRVSLVLHREAMAEECRTARIVIFRFERKGPCAGPELVLDRHILEQDGAVAVWLDSNSLMRSDGISENRENQRFPGATGDLRMEHAAPRLAGRPWHRQAPSDRQIRPDQKTRERPNNRRENLAGPGKSI